MFVSEQKFKAFWNQTFECSQILCPSLIIFTEITIQRKNWYEEDL